jgi:hypothetical protein
MMCADIGWAAHALEIALHPVEHPARIFKTSGSNTAFEAARGLVETGPALTTRQNICVRIELHPRAGHLMNLMSH